MIVDLALALIRWLAGIVAVAGSAALMIAWTLGLLDKYPPAEPTSTLNPKDRQT
jgi:hypothetical protein